MRFAVARQQGLSEERAALVGDGHADADLTPEQKAALAYADVFLGHGGADPGALPEATRAELERCFSPEGIVEITLAAALFLGMSKMLIALGLEPESMPTTVIATPGSA